MAHLTSYAGNIDQAVLLLEYPQRVPVLTFAFHTEAEMDLPASELPNLAIGRTF